jgi:hypothetical protein
MPDFIRRSARLVAFVLIALFAASSNAGVFTASAQGATPDPAISRITVAAVLCTDASCIDFGDRLHGVEITAVDRASGAALDSCLTDTQSQGCELEMPANAAWDLTWTEDAIPAGWEPFGSIINVEDGPFGSITYIPFVPRDREEPGHIVVQAALCTDASCDEFAEYLEGFEIVAVAAGSGEELDSCVTGNPQQNLDHRCILDVPANDEVEITWAAADVPDGHVPFGETIEVGEPVTYTVAFVPEDDPEPTNTPGSVTSLPETGSGEELDTTASRPAELVALATVAMAVLGFSLYRQVRRRRT